MNLKKKGALLTICFLMVFAGPAFGELILGATRDNLPFPSYGIGKVIVRIYTDYFCPPCRAAEPELEPLLIDLVKSKKITVTFVDTPIYKDSQLYAKYFLYALNKKNDFKHALLVRSALFEAAVNKISGKETLEEFLNGKGIAFTPFDAVPVLKKLNGLLQDDKVTGTPTCVIVKNGISDKRVGGGEILKALKEIEQTGTPAGTTDSK
jgi:thiol:disulfide interchange protein DsbA